MPCRIQQEYLIDGDVDYRQIVRDLKKEKYLSEDGTDYLLSTPANAKHLDESIVHVESGQIVESNLPEDSDESC